MTKAQEAMEKYMNAVPSHLGDLVAYLNKPAGEVLEYEAGIVQELKEQLQAEIKVHFEKTATTRQMFVSMASDHWQDPSNHLFNLTEVPRKVLGYLPKPELQKLDNLVKDRLAAEVTARREQLHKLHEEMRVSEGDKQEVAATLAREGVFFEDLKAHHNELLKWRPLAEKKVPIITELAQREEFLEEVEEFEHKTTDNPDRFKKLNSLAIAEENKFRSFASKKRKELDARAIQLCQIFEKETGRAFEIDGTNYLNLIKEQAEGQSKNPNLPAKATRHGNIKHP